MPGYYKYYHQTPTLYVPTSLLSPHCRVLSNDGQAIRVSLNQHCTSVNLLMVTWARLELATPNLRVLYSRPSELPGQVSAHKAH